MVTNMINKKKKVIRGDQVIWLIVMLLSLISIVAVYSSSTGLAYKAETSTYSFLFKQMGFVIAGITALLICYKIPLKIYRNSSIIIFIISLILLAYVAFKGPTINHAERWITLGPLSFQPAELAKISVVLYLARILEIFSFKTWKEYILWIIVPLCLMSVLSLLGSVSATIIIIIVAFFILVCSGINKKYILSTIGIALVAALLIYGIHKIWNIFPRLNTFEARIERFMGSNKDLDEKKIAEFEEKDFQAKQAKEAIQLGGLFGVGPGNSIKKATLPHPYSDFIYTIIIEEAGSIIATFIMWLYLWFFFRCRKISSYCNRIFSTVVVLGLGILITLQAFIHIFVNVGLLPVTGQTLPLISLGGTSFLIMSSAVGIILSVNRTIEINKERELIQQENLNDNEK